jgi:hypothetical protein
MNEKLLFDLHVLPIYIILVSLVYLTFAKLLSLISLSVSTSHF